MTKLPPLLPEYTFARVLRLARLDGLSVMMVATFFALLAAMSGNRVGAIAGLLIAGAGAVELHGTHLLQQGETRGMSWLVGSQLFLLVSVLVYCAVRLADIQVPPVPDAFAATIDLTAQQLGMSRREYLEFVQRLGLRILAVVSIFYQGAMAIYYYRRRHAVARALAIEPSEA